MTYEREERVAICVESGVPQERAEEIAECEGTYEVLGCYCGTHGGDE